MIIDVSSNNPQELPSWATGVIIKLSEGTSYVNPFAPGFLAQAKDMAIPMAGYHFVRSFTASEIAFAVSQFEAAVAQGYDLQYLMLDVEGQSLALAKNLAPLSVPCRTYGSISQQLTLARVGFPLMLAWWGPATEAQARLTTAEGMGAHCLQWTNDYLGYDAWIGNVFPDVTVADPTPTPEPVASQTFTWPSGPNGEGWIRITNTAPIASVVALSTVDPSSGSTEVSFYPRFVVTGGSGYQVISWSGAQPSSTLTFEVFFE